ncbi:hypothetical protein VEx25_0613, partial [Vibrio antiquarius]
MHLNILLLFVLKTHVMRRFFH